MSTIDEIRKKVDNLTNKVFVEGYKAGYEKGIKVTDNNYLSGFLEWLNNEVAIIGKDQDGKTHILVARRVKEDPQKLIWADAVQEFNLRDQQPEEPTPVNEITFEGTLKESKIISSDGSEVSE